ncbi:olefin beta-lactone synthetase [Colwellia psychrerythraea]|uniref:AMP-dependent synthetase and ligase n=1 Tax=Colwellia psychrerythraea TaxID=28229 RepID=A0A099KHL4_COLPS|nr:fatty acid CoA ligase family protein [Colwellia psychrerythraea]KGJ89851.1 AMP-dependent synthetase and ligase [Colwellia psychrerythraea]
MTEVMDKLKATPNQANLCRHLAHAAITTPTALAVAVQKYRGGKLNYQEIDFVSLHQRSDEIAHALNAYGLTSGMKTVLMVTPSIDFFALTFALFKAGIVPILVDPGMGIKNLKQCFNESQPDAFIGIPKAHIARVLFGWGKGSVKKLLTVTEGGSASNAGVAANIFASFIGGMSLNKLLIRYPMQNNGLSKPDTSYNMVKLNDDAMSAILFTSGSTGTPKGVVYSHKMFEAQIRALKEDYAIKPGERDLATFPLFSLFGPALGMASIVPDMDASKPIKANPDFIFAAIEKYQCSNLFANPALIEVLGLAGTSLTPAIKLNSLKRVISAGAPATLPSIERFTHLLSAETPILTSYGATESLPLTKIASVDLLSTSQKTDNGGGICVGAAINGVEISIIAITEDVIDTWHEGLSLPINTIGEIVVKGDMVSHQYYQRDAATAQAKIAQGNQVRHRMGDLGYLDEYGLLWMCGRKAHRVETEKSVLFSIPCERIFNTHRLVKRTALVGVKINHKNVPLLCIELTDTAKIDKNFDESRLFSALKVIALAHKQTTTISHFLIHEQFPVDIRHNAKIFREKLAVWAQQELD